METKLAVMVFLVVLSTVEFGEALKCYVGVSGVSTTKEECAGSCTTVESTITGTKTTAVACSPTKQKDGCIDLGTTGKSCYCNTDLCNTGEDTKPATKPTTKATPKNGTSAMRAHFVILAMVLFSFVGKRVFHI